MRTIISLPSKSQSIKNNLLQSLHHSSTSKNLTNDALQIADLSGSTWAASTAMDTLGFMGKGSRNMQHGHINIFSQSENRPINFTLLYAVQTLHIKKLQGHYRHSICL